MLSFCHPPSSQSNVHPCKNGFLLTLTPSFFLLIPLSSVAMTSYFNLSSISFPFSRLICLFSPLCEIRSEQARRGEERRDPGWLVLVDAARIECQKRRRASETEWTRGKVLCCAFSCCRAWPTIQSPSTFKILLLKRWTTSRRSRRSARAPTASSTRPGIASRDRSSRSRKSGWKREYSVKQRIHKADIFLFSLSYGPFCVYVVSRQIIGILWKVQNLNLLALLFLSFPRVSRPFLPLLSSFPPFRVGSLVYL